MAFLEAACRRRSSSPMNDFTINILCDIAMLCHIVSCQALSGSDGRISMVWLPGPAMENFPWQLRSRAAGLTQRLLGKLLGHNERTISFQLRGHWKSGVPRHVRSAIIAWEIMSPVEREQWIATVEREFGHEIEKSSLNKDAPKTLEKENQKLRTQLAELTRLLENKK